MPMKSQKQRRYLWANEPEVAAEFEAKTPKGKKLPERVKTKSPARRPAATKKKK
jgi:hypothetical protein